MNDEREKLKKKHENVQIVIYPPLLISTIAFLPPPIFDIDMVFNKNQGKLSDLSSGEKQIIYSIQGVLYHLINISSKNSFRSKIKNSYQYINIIFDEVELYFHPDMQRKFISSLLVAIKGTYLSGIQGINILFITHSPFILSDIPKQNVLFLENDEMTRRAKPQQYAGDNTFGANVHEMLTNGFFLGSTKGAFAISKIEEILDFYQKVKNLTDLNKKQLLDEYHKNKESFFQIIDMIGERYVKNVLKNHFEEIQNKLNILDFDALKKKEEELERELKSIRRRLNK